MTVYNGEHSITFGEGEIENGVLEGANTWETWYLIPSSRPTMSVPAAQNKYVEIPGMNGSYDISSYLTTDVTYSDRSGSFEFVVDNDHADWMTIYRDILTYLHGQPMKMILSDDPDWYYIGRFSVNQWKSDPARSSVTIDYRVQPFKYSVYPAFVENQIWDIFNFERDTDWSLFWHININDTSEYAIKSYGVRDSMTVRLVEGSSITASFGGVTETLTTAGEEVILGNGNRSGESKLTLSGTGIVDVGWNKTSM